MSTDIGKLAVADVRAIMAAIRGRRNALGLKQKDVAERIGVHSATYAQWESGGNFPPARDLARAARAVGLRLIAVPADKELHEQLAAASPPPACGRSLSEGWCPEHGYGTPPAETTEVSR